MADDDPLTLEKLVRALRPDRVAFAAVYDRERPSDAFDFKTISMLRARLASETEAERDRNDVLAALRAAQEEGWLSSFNPIALREIGTDPTLAIRFQAITNPDIDFDHIGDISDGVLNAMRRCCRIVCGDDTAGNATKGSGFLIGPQLVLTNWHVVKAAISALENYRAKLLEEQRTDSNIIMLPPPVRLRVEFDSLRLRDGTTTAPVIELLAEDWLVAYSDDGGQIRATQTGDVASYPQGLEVLEKSIDFAVIALANPVGYERGWYELREDLPLPKQNSSGQLIQYPGNFAMRVTAGPYLSTEEVPGRLKHSMNTIGGASGGLCATTGYEPLALHQGALVVTDVLDPIENSTLPTGTENVAIPLAFIARASGEKIAARATMAPARIHRLTGKFNQNYKDHPVIGRGLLQHAIHESISGPNRIIVVRNSFDSETGQLKGRIGKSFTVNILGEMTDPTANFIREVNAVDLSTDAYESARVLLTPFEESEAPQEIAEALNRVKNAKSLGMSSSDADMRELADFVIAALRSVAGRRTLWLVIDKLDVHPISSPSTTSTLLSCLYEGIAIEDRLRAVLIGPTRNLSLPPGKFAVDGPLGDFEETELEQWMQLARGPGRPMTRDAITMLQRIVTHMLPEWRPQEQLSRCERIAQILKTIVAPQLA